MKTDDGSTTGGKVMKKPSEIKKVSLTYTADTGWTMSADGGDPVSPAQFAPIVISYGWEGKITFTIKDSPANVTFADQPIAVAPFINWETKPNGMDPQFTLKKVSPTEIVVDDLNGNPGKPFKGYDGGHFNYGLQFNNAPAIDPIITNNGCCSPTGSLDYDALGGAGMLALLVVAVRPLVKKGVATAARGREQP